MKIQEMRKQLNMTQKEFAEKFHISLRTLQRWEQGQNEPPLYATYCIKRIIELEREVEGYDNRRGYNIL